MKQNLQLITFGAAALMLGGTAIAQETTAAKLKEPVRRVEKATDLIGREIRNYQNEPLGYVRELAIHLETGEIGEVLISNNGYSGTPDTWIGIAPSALHWDANGNVLRLDSDRVRLLAEPHFESWQWIAFSQSNKMDEVYRYQGGDAFRNIKTADDVPWGLWRFTDEDIKSRAALTGTKRIVPSPNWAAYLGYLQRATVLMQTTVRNQQNESVGKIENLMLDLGTGRVVSVVVSSGGFLGMTGELSAMPSEALLDRRGFEVVRDPNRPAFMFSDTNFAAPEKNVGLNTTRVALDKAPHFSGNQWPDFGDVLYTESIYRAYNLEPHVRVAYLDLARPGQ